MNKKLWLLGLLAVGLVSAGYLHADDLVDSAKRNPRFLENGTTCVTKISYPAYALAMQNNPLFKSGQITLPDRVVERRVQYAAGEIAGGYKFSSGNQQTDFFSGPINIVFSDEIGEAAVVGLVAFARDDLKRTHFPELTWVRPEHFKGLVEVNRKKFFLFADEDRELFVSPETHYPVKFRSSSQIYEYSVLPQHLDKVDVSPAIRQQLQQLQALAD